MSLLGGAHIGEDASDVAEPEVVKLDDASGCLEGHSRRVTLRSSPLQGRGGGLAFLTSPQVMVLLALDPPF